LPLNPKWKARNITSGRKLGAFIRSNRHQLGPAAEYLNITRDTLSMRVSRESGAGQIEGIILMEGYLRSVDLLPALPISQDLFALVERGIAEKKITLTEVSQAARVSLVVARRWLGDGRVSTFGLNADFLRFFLYQRRLLPESGLTKLPERLRAVFWLLYEDRLTLDQLCEELESPKHNVLRYLSWARQPPLKLDPLLDRVIEKYGPVAVDRPSPIDTEKTISIQQPELIPATVTDWEGPVVIQPDDLVRTILFATNILTASLTQYLNLRRDKSAAELNKDIARLRSRNPELFFELENVVAAISDVKALQRWRKEAR